MKIKKFLVMPNIGALILFNKPSSAFCRPSFTVNRNFPSPLTNHHTHNHERDLAFQTLKSGGKDPKIITNKNIFWIRGGDSSTSSATALFSVMNPATEALQQALVSGTNLHALGALYAVASLTVVPLTLIRQAYSFSVGYGLSVATMALAILSSFTFSGGQFKMSNVLSSNPSALAFTALVYGIRLSAFILAREFTVESKRKQFKSLDSLPPLKRMPLALGVSLLYAFMVAPVLFAFRSSVEAGSSMQKVQSFFIGLSAFGMVVESITDQHKYEVKRKNNQGEETFVGPTTWFYKICRHPNYLGEILFWLGLFSAGSVSFGKSIAAWVSSCLGLWGILAIMLGAASRLDKKQADKYGGQPLFETWKDEVPFSVIPWIK